MRDVVFKSKLTEDCSKDTIRKYVEELLPKLTREEKIGIMSGQITEEKLMDDLFVINHYNIEPYPTKAVERLGVPNVRFVDGPRGVVAGSATCFPVSMARGATFDRDLEREIGKAVGAEVRAVGGNYYGGVCINLLRNPRWGRAQETYGEDPYLLGEMGAALTEGVQSQNVMACVKHFALNNQEQNRLYHDVVVDDRALHEIYLPAFKAAVEEGGAWAIMGAYNKYKGQHCCHNQYLLNDILKHDWGFDGVVVSDWGGAHDTKQAAENGLDLEFGSWTNGVDWSLDISNVYGNYFLAGPYLEMLRQGKASVKQLDDKARRVLKLIFRTAMNTRKPFGSLNSPEHLAAARRIAGEGMVLLKNDSGALPIDLARTKTIAVVGENAIKMMTVGGGSSSLKVRHEYTPLEGIRAAADGKAEVIYERGYVGDVTGDYNGVKTGQDLSEKRSEAQLIADAVAAARKADAVIFVGGLNKSRHQDSEQVDRLEYGLPYSQDKVIKALADANPKLAVVIVSGNAVAMPWIDRVPAVLEAWFSGSEAGNALADVVFGAVNPSGKLPFTFPVRLEDNSAHALGEYPGSDKVTYNESIFVGYRWHDKQELKPLFAFGHGLSYTTFDIACVKADRTTLAANGRIRISANVTNTGSREGSEVVQLYIGDEKSSLPRPVKELKGFQKIALKPSETKTVMFEITPEMLQYYDNVKGMWVTEPGTFTAYVGVASDDIRSIIRFELE